MHKHVDVECLAARSSDHKPLLLSISKEEGRNHRKSKVFKFRACWTKDGDYC